MNDRKYIIVKESTFKTAILFEGVLSHDDFLKVYDKDDIVSAGFFQVYIKDGELCVSTYGKSTTLELESKKEDSRLIERILKDKW